MDSSQRKGGGLVPISPSHTPRSSDKASGNGNSSSKQDRDRGVNVQVLLRCRPLSEDEVKTNTPVVISCNEQKREVSATQNIGNKQIDRTFVFDKVFGPNSRQKDLYDQAISPIVNEVLGGYNCTIFAYGQTGTGKTYTMEGGGHKNKNGEFPSHAGVIPRAVRQIFDVLEAQSAEYSMKVTFLELYNEEITDLLAPEESKSSDEKTKKPLALMEDGKGGVFVRGLEEEIVYSASDIYKILDKGSGKRRTAETLLNKQSSRSHSVFSITTHIKECTHEGEEMITSGKLNLVDLAGSENISRSGAKEGRAREAGEINKSLLTLGRVINTLVEHSGHIPYRDSKLTRLLRDSLGGKTKTCIIATVSPSVHSLEETLSTLDYAHRAKSIKNKPEVNQKMMKSALIKDLYAEIDRLKQEVYAAREKNGVYIPRDRYMHEEAEKKAMIEKMERFDLDMESRDKQLAELQDLYRTEQLVATDLSDKLEKNQRKLQDTEHDLCELKKCYKQANSTIKEKEYLISFLLRSEKSLTQQAHALRSELENASADMSGLFSKIERKDEIEDRNKVLIQRFHSQLTSQLDILHKTVSDSILQQEAQLKEMDESMQSFVSAKADATEEVRGRVKKLKDIYGSRIRQLDGIAGEVDLNSQSTFENLNSQVSTHSSALEECLKGIVLEADQLLKELQSNFSKQEDKLAAFALQQRQGHLRTVERARSISKVTTNFFHKLDIQASKLCKSLKETQTIQEQKLNELKQKFEECSANEERLLLEKVAEIVASSSARKKLLVQEAVDSLCEDAADRTSNLQNEIGDARAFTSSFKEKWMVFEEETEHHFEEDTAAVEAGRSCLDEGFQQCGTKAEMISQQWENAQDSLSRLQMGNVASIDSIVRSGIDTNALLHAKLSSVASTTLSDFDIANKCLLSSIDGSLKLDQDAVGALDSMITQGHGRLRELTTGHHEKIVEITEDARTCLEEEYTVDEPSCSTPRRRQIDLPSAGSIEELRTPAFEELLESFRKTNSTQANADAKQFSGPYESQLQALRDSRAPLTPIN